MEWIVRTGMKRLRHHTAWYSMHLRPVIWVFIQINMTTLTVHWPAKCHNDVLTPNNCLLCLFSLKCRCQRQMFCFAFSVRSGSKVPNGHRVGSCQGTCCTNHLLQLTGSHVSSRKIGHFYSGFPKSTGVDSLEVAQRISDDFTTHHGTFSAIPQPEPRSNQRPSWWYAHSPWHEGETGEKLLELCGQEMPKYQTIFQSGSISSVRAPLRKLRWENNGKYLALKKGITTIHNISSTLSLSVYAEWTLR